MTPTNSPEGLEHHEGTREPGVGRRAALGLTAGAVGAAAGLGAGIAVSDGASATTKSLVVDVAAIGETFRLFPAPALLPDANLDPSDLRGSMFWTEGYIYPEGTIQGDGFVPTSEGAIGHWMCRGHIISSATRPEPHIISNQEFIFGLIRPDRLFPPDTLTSAGLEATNEGLQDSLRAVTGGSGIYRGAAGQVLEIETGLNASVQPGLDLPAPNFRFEFDLDIPST